MSFPEMEETNMNRRIAIGVALLLLMATAGRAQEKAAAAKDKLTPLKVQVVFSEFEGEKKVASLPYTLLVNASEELRRSGDAMIRVGVRIPIITQVKEGPAVQYIDVGTNIDADAEIQPEGRFLLVLSVRRSFVYSPEGEKRLPEVSSQVASGNPILRSFDARFHLLLKDGETIQSTLATDPVSGRVMKVDVTLTIVK
jgi:hypothetical protein